MNALHGVAVLSLLACSMGAQAAWTRRYPPVSPPARQESQMVFDPVRGVCLLFSGNLAGNPNGDFWQWSGTNWSQLPGGPPASIAAAMVFDAARGRVVLFGGYTPTTSGGSNATWEWDGTNWLVRSPAHVPPARADAAAAYDPRRSVTVLFGGYAASYLGDLWEWNGNDWSLRTAANGPGARAGARMTFDPNTNTVLLFGGGGPGLTFDETWTWNGTTWQQQLPGNMPYARAGHVMVTDAARRRVIVHGGSASYDPYAWEWDGSTWTMRVTASPSVRGSSSAAYDADHRCMVMFGGAASSQPLADTWTYATASPATASPYGVGCPGSAGTPSLTNEPFWLPWLGDAFRTQLNGLAAASTVAVFATGVDATMPVDLTMLGMPGCFGLVAVVTADFALATAGTAHWGVMVPNSTAFNGAHLYQQAFALEAGVNAAGVITSNALDCSLGIR